VIGKADGWSPEDLLLPATSTETTKQQDGYRQLRRSTKRETDAQNGVILLDTEGFRTFVTKNGRMAVDLGQMRGNDRLIVD